MSRKENEREKAVTLLEVYGALLEGGTPDLPGTTIMNYD